jgi:hypothetical protein
MRSGRRSSFVTRPGAHGCGRGANDGPD